MKPIDNVILASGSPRRQELLQAMGIPFTVLVKQIDESFPESLTGANAALFIASKKADAYQNEAASGSVVITADTIVCIEGKILGKPADEAEAFSMLRMLSGKCHEVITAVCLLHKQQKVLFHDTTLVCFKPLTDEEIRYYISTCRPFDKAGGYGIQEWIGLIGIERIEGSYHNVVGLPVRKVYEQLMKFSAA